MSSCLGFSWLCSRDLPFSSFEQVSAGPRGAGLSFVETTEHGAVPRCLGLCVFGFPICLLMSPFGRWHGWTQMQKGEQKNPSFGRKSYITREKGRVEDV